MTDAPAATEQAEAPSRERKSVPLFDRFMLLIGFGGVLRAIRSPSRSTGQVVQSLQDKFIEVLGFGGVLKAWRRPDRKVKHVLASIFDKGADLAGRRAFVGAVKLAAIAAVVGMSGVSIYMTIGVVALASGAASGLFTFVKTFLTDSIVQRGQARLFTADRLKETGKSFAGGAAGGAIVGAVGGWIARVPFIRSLLGSLKSAFNGASPPSLPSAATGTGIAPPMVKGYK